MRWGGGDGKEVRGGEKERERERARERETERERERERERGRGIEGGRDGVRNGEK